MKDALAVAPNQPRLSAPQGSQDLEQPDLPEFHRNPDLLMKPLTV